MTHAKPAAYAGEFPPRVLVPWGDDPDNDFDRNGFDPEFLWLLIKEILDATGPYVPERFM